MEGSADIHQARNSCKKLVDYKTPDGIECRILEINMNSKKWILFGIYRPPSQTVNYFFEEMGKAIDYYSNRSENFITLSDLNIEEKQKEMKTFMEIYRLKNGIKQPTCFKSDNPTCRNLILTNRPSSFQILLQ